MSLKPMPHLRMVRTRARDFYSAKPCPLIKFRSCSLGFRRRNSLRDKKLQDGKSVKDKKAKNSLGANVFLETSIGVRLLDRTTRSVALTDEGRRLYGEIGPLLSGIEDAFTQTAGCSAAVRGRLRVNVSAFFATTMFAPFTGEFLERYPELSLELVTRDQLGDLVADGFDIAVRFGNPPSSSLIARK